MTTLKRIHDYALHIVVAILIFIVGFFVVINVIPKPQFSYDKYEEQHSAFVKCVDNPRLMEEAKTLYTSFLDMDGKDVQTKLEAITGSHTCDPTFVTSSYEQVQTMALEVVKAAQAYYGTDKIKVVDSAYTSDAKFSALLDHPQEYLFYVSDEKQTKIVAFTIYPTKEGYQITPLWDIDKSSDITYTQDKVQHLLILYNEIKK